MNLPYDRLLFINSIKHWFFIFVDQVVRISDKFELLLVSESQVVSEVFFQVIYQEVVLLWLEESVVVFVQNYYLFAQIL